MQPIPIVIGFDPREAAAYHVCCQSIIKHATVPVALIPLATQTLSGYESNRRDGSNDFIYSRFLVPWLMRYQGHALFIDGDMLVREDVAELWKLRRFDRGVQVVKHDYKTKHPRKYFGAPNADYPRKNWSSVVLWNCGYYPNHRLTPAYVAQATGAHLHRFAWLKDEQIGELPARWNHLCMEYEPSPDAAIYHYTIGIPGLPEYREQEGGDEWHRTLSEALTPIAGTATCG